MSDSEDIEVEDGCSEVISKLTKPLFDRVLSVAPCANKVRSETTLNTRQLAFTVRTVGDTIDTDYAKILAMMRKHGNIPYYTTEQDSGTSHHGTHIHGVIEISKKFNPKRLQTKGYHVYTKQITDYRGWQAYCNKYVEPIKKSRRLATISSPIISQ